MSRTPALPLTQAAALRRRCQRLLADHRRRAKAENATLDYGLTDLLSLPAVVCTYCGALLAGDFSLDHLQPLARGGQHVLANLVVVCRPCNLRKGRLTSSEYRQLLALLATWPAAAQEDVRRRLVGGGAAVYARQRKKKEQR